VEDHGAFLRAFDDSGGAAKRYFDAVASTCRARSAVLAQAPARRRLHRIATALEHGVYGRRSGGGFGSRAVTRDVAVFAAGNASQYLIRAR